MNDRCMRSLSKQIILVVDDDRETREALASLLCAAQFSAAVFGSAKDVLQSSLLAQACCLITDVRMPGMSGFELKQALKRHYPRLPVFLITGHRDEQTLQREMREGEGRFFYKPIDPDILLEAIRSAVER